MLPLYAPTYYALTITVSYWIFHRCKYGAQLQAAIKSFLSEFVQHMKEEEAVFGPLLKENFERKELEDMNETVLKQHTLFREKVRQEFHLLIC